MEEPHFSATAKKVITIYMLQVNTPAPNFELEDQDGKVRKLSDYVGKWLLIYFYPKDDTPGCTKEACTLRDSYKEFEKMGVSVIGVSTDTIESHKKFQEKYMLPFILLSDPDKNMVNDYGVWGMKKFMGREFEGTKRDSFLTNPKGEIVKIYEGVTPDKHASEVIDDLKKFLSENPSLNTFWQSEPGK